MKIVRYKNIPQMVQHGQWEADFSPDRFIYNLDSYVQNDGLQMDPDFQRGHVWSESQQRSFIEFFLRGGKTARVVYLNNPSWRVHIPPGDYNDFVIVDGKQRVEAWRKFFANELRVFGSYASQFTDKIPRDNTMKIHVNDLRTRAEVLQWYVDFNAGGVLHTDEEIERVRQMLAAERFRTAGTP